MNSTNLVDINQTFESMEETIVFLYGSDRLREQCISEFSVCKATVNDWALVFGHDLKGGLASIVPCSGWKTKGYIAQLNQSQLRSIQEYEGIKLSDGIYEMIEVPVTFVRDAVENSQKAKVFVLSREVILRSIQNYCPPHPSYLQAVWENISDHWNLSAEGFPICRVAEIGSDGHFSLAVVDTWRPAAAAEDATNCIVPTQPNSGAAVSESLSDVARIDPSPGRVFVATYGTLRRGMRNYHVNSQGGGVLFCAGRTAGSFCLYSCRGADFPCLSLRAGAPHAHPVVVDVFEVLPPPFPPPPCPQQPSPTSRVSSIEFRKPLSL